MPLREIYLKLSVTFADDPKVRSLIRYGVDGILARDLYVQMCLHCKRMLTDGFVAAEQVGLLSYPLPQDHANQLAKQLASVGLINEVSNPEAQGWQVAAFLKRNGTKEDVERLSEVRAEAGRSGGRPPRKPAGQSTREANRKQNAKQNESQANPYTETESVKEKEHGSLTRADIGTDKDPDFAAFWSIYPRAGAAGTRPGKGQARANYRKAVITDGADPKLITAAAERFRDFHAKAHTAPKYIPHAATWLKGERYNEDPADSGADDEDFWSA